MEVYYWSLGEIGVIWVVLDDFCAGKLTIFGAFLSILNVILDHFCSISVYLQALSSQFHTYIFLIKKRPDLSLKIGPFLGIFFKWQSLYSSKIGLFSNLTWSRVNIGIFLWFLYSPWIFSNRSNYSSFAALDIWSCKIYVYFTDSSLDGLQLSQVMYWLHIRMPRISIRKLFVYLLAIASCVLLALNIQQRATGLFTSSLTPSGPSGPPATEKEAKKALDGKHLQMELVSRTFI